uniref:Uncharacterized protein n=1 Tax=Anguilla anguilla TaxID=7936 RepID=A0A0E9XPK8_ANGAN
MSLFQPITCHYTHLQVTCHSKGLCRSTRESTSMRESSEEWD